jgi:hypothetical protein
MTMQASTLGILEAADFSPKQARALAQAIEGEIKGSDLVTKPIFESGIGSVKLEIAELNGALRTELARLDGALRIELARLNGELKTELGRLNGEFRTELGRLNGEFRTELGGLDGKLRTELKHLENRLFGKTVALGLTASSIIIGAVYFLILHLKP